MLGRPSLRALALATVLVSTAGCGFLRDLTQEESPPSVPLSAEAPLATAGPRPRPVVAAEGFLAAGGERVGTVTVTVGPVVTGLVPPVPNFSDSCPVAEAGLQYVPVDVAFTRPGFAARLDIGTGPGTPSDIGDVGVVVESGNGSESYCFDYPPLPTSDRFWNTVGADTVTGYVVLDEAVSSATPDGRADVFPTLRLRLSDLRVYLHPTNVMRLTVEDMSVGAPCPDEADAICVALG